MPFPRPDAAMLMFDMLGSGEFVCHAMSSQNPESPSALGPVARVDSALFARLCLQYAYRMLFDVPPKKELPKGP